MAVDEETVPVPDVAGEAVRLAAPTVEHHRVPLGIGERRPRTGWRTERAPAGWRSVAYEVEATRAGATRTSGWVDGPGGRLVPWPFDDLASRDRVDVRVRVRDVGGAVSGWSPATRVEAGLLDPADWVAVAITPDVPVPDADLRRPPLLRHGFRLDAPVVRARLYLTGHGLVEARLNGRPVGDHALAPGWTVYPSHLVYATHDVTGLVHEGENALGVLLGDGWYRGRLGFDGGTRDIYGDRLAALAQLEVEHADGTRTVVGTGPGWRAGEGPVLSAGLYEGQQDDAREEPAGWDRPGFDATAWDRAAVVPRDPATLVAPEAPPVRCTQEIAPVDVRRTARGTTLVDFGQNLVGRLRLRVHAPAGTTIRLRHAEVLEGDALSTRPLRAAASVDELTTDGRALDWEPRFTVHGFRYAELEGWPGDVAPGDVVARVLHTDMRRTGGFACSDPRLDRLHENVVWSTRGNFVGLPTDCPQRDERLGWTGDIQVFAPTATFLYDCAGLLSSWLRDLALEQLPDGTVPWYVPTIYGNPMWSPPRPGAAWGDAAVVVPWELFQRYGDRDVLARQYGSAKAWVECVERLAGPDRLWDDGFQLGDWLDPAAPPDDPAAARADRYLVATACFARSAHLLALSAAELGHADDATRFAALAAEVRAAFVGRWGSGGGRLTSDAPTSYALALHLGLLPEDQRAAAADRLAELVRDGGDRIATGFVGTPVILHALADHGHLDRAYALLMQTQCPSWLYMVGMGATTIWERWDSMLPDGTVNPGDMTSFNHYALGAVADWLHTTVAGLRQESPDGDRFRIAPRPGGGLTWASAWLESTHGRIATRWDVDGDDLVVTVDVPACTTAVVDLPGQEPAELGPGRHEVRAPGR